jgi:hypothetical protein
VPDVPALLSAWNGFYVMIGSAAAALTGLMFVVITITNDTRRGATAAGVSTFSTPTVVHFSAALFTAAVMSAPFPSFVPIEIILGLAGTAGMVHVVRIAVRTSQLETYQPDSEDWSWYVLLPFLAYAAITGGAIAMHADPARALYAPAAGAATLIFAGIHNSWDVVTYLATGKADASND